MRFARLLLIAAVCSLDAQASLAADTEAPQTSMASAIVAAPQWRVGSSWEYSDGYALKVTSNHDGTTNFERVDAPGQWFSMRGFLRQDAESASVKRQTIYRTVNPSSGDALKGAEPLTFQREYLSNNRLIVHATSWTVEGRQRITVPAGTFDCWVIVWRARSLKSDWTGFERWWYSPEVQHYVRLEYQYGNSPTASRVLMRYRLAEPGETVAESSGASARSFGASVESVLRPVTMNAGITIALAPMTLNEMQIIPEPDTQIALTAAPSIAAEEPVKKIQATTKTKSKLKPARRRLRKRR